MPRVGLASANASPRIRCATVGRLTCWRPAPTYAPSKSCSGTVIWKPPPSTCICRSGTCRQLTIRWTVSVYPAPRTSATALNEKTKNDSAHLRGGRHSSRAGRSLSGSLSIQFWLSAAQSVSGHSALPHRCAGRSSRRLPELRASGHLIQLVQKSALPQVPDAGARALVGGSRTRTPDHQLLPCCVHCAPRTQRAGPGKPAFVLRPAVHRQRSNLARDRHRSQTPGRRDRHDQHPAHLGTEPASAPPHSLRHSCRWTLARSPLLDPPTLSFLLTGEGPQPRLSRQVPRRPATSAQPRQAMLQRPRRRSGRPTAVCKTPAPPAPPRLGRLCQAAFGGLMQVLRYLGRYTHRVAISNHRLLAFDQERVTFRWKDYAHGGKQG